MTHFRQLRPALLVAAASVLGLAGCSSIKLDQTGETVAVYQFGDFQMLLNSNASVAFKATEKAFQELDLFATKTKLNTFDGELYARSRKDEKIHVKIAEINSRQTLLTIEWGPGDKNKSLQLYKSIDSHTH